MVYFIRGELLIKTFFFHLLSFRVFFKVRISAFARIEYRTVIFFKVNNIIAFQTIAMNQNRAKSKK